MVFIWFGKEQKIVLEIIMSFFFIRFYEHFLKLTFSLSSSFKKIPQDSITRMAWWLLETRDSFTQVKKGFKPLALIPSRPSQLNDDMASDDAHLFRTYNLHPHISPFKFWQP